MKQVKIFSVLLFVFFSFSLQAQKIPVADLYRILDMATMDIKAYLKDKGYTLSQSDSSSTASSWYFTAMEKKDTMIYSFRSVTLMETSFKKFEGRLIAYRTYIPEEHGEIMAYLSANGFVLGDSYKTNDGEEFFYRAKDRKVHYTIATNKREDGRLLKSYTIEIGN